MKQKRDYLSEFNSEANKGYIRKTTYIQKEPLDTESSKYFLLPEEYDIFSGLDLNVICKKDTTQYKLISECLSYMREKLMSLYLAQHFTRVLPKLSFSEDEVGTITLNWAHSNFRAFLSFEGEEGNYDAYCGVVAQIDIDAISTQTRKIDMGNYQAAVDSIIQLVIDYP